MIHVANPAFEFRLTSYCGAQEPANAIDFQELRRRIHSRGRVVVEPTICPACFKNAWPERRSGRDRRAPGLSG